MKLALAIATFGMLAAGGAAAQSPAELAKAKNCLSCHMVDKKVVGPSYKQIAAKYAGQKDIVPKLVTKVRAGGAGVWGVVPMPANPQVNQQEAEILVKWILSLK
jgi:cytochrome c